MRLGSSWLIAVGATLLAFAMSAEAKALVAPTGVKPGLLTAQADVVVIGKVVEIEKEPVEATQFAGAPKDQKMSFRIAVVKIEEGIIGGKGLTQFRVGFPADAPAVSGPAAAAPPAAGGVGARVRIARPGAGIGAVSLTEGMEGIFFLSQHHEADFYVQPMNSRPLLKKDEKYAKSLEDVKKVAKTLADPVPALKAKDLADRYHAAQILLYNYQTPRKGKGEREPIPAEENKLILDVLLELPWAPKADPAAPATGDIPPNRSALWNLIRPTELGFRSPKFPARKPGDPPVDSNKVWEEATAAFVKDNVDRIKIQRYVK